MIAKKWYFTFGFDHPYRKGYVEVYAEDSEAARTKMIDRYGLKWGFQYSESEFLGQPTKFGLHRVAVIP